MPSLPSGPARAARLAELIARPFAHRGLHGRGCPENSRAAFQAAIDAGHGIELDVQVSADGEAIVFHDFLLERLAHATGPICGLAARAIAEIRLREGRETIPTLADALKLIDGRSALLVEIKAPGRRVGTLSGAVHRALQSYVGPVAVMSFNPGVGRWFSRNAPDVLRGLVVTEAAQPRRGRLRRRLSALWARPDFLAYDIRDLPSPFAEAQRRRGRPILTWTCRSETEREQAALFADQIIFESPQ